MYQDPNIVRMVPPARKGGGDLRRPASVLSLAARRKLVEAQRRVRRPDPEPEPAWRRLWARVLRLLGRVPAEPPQEVIVSLRARCLRELGRCAMELRGA